MINPLLITKVGQIVYWSFKIKNDSLVVNKDVTVALTVPSDFVYVDANQPIVTRGSVIGTNWVITSGTQTMLPGEEATFTGTYVLDAATHGINHDYIFTAVVTALKNNVVTNNTINNTVTYEEFADCDTPVGGAIQGTTAAITIDLNDYATKCTTGLNRFVLIENEVPANTTANGTLISWDQDTGIVLLKHIRPDLPITFKWALKCIVSGNPIDVSCEQIHTVSPLIDNIAVFNHIIDSALYSDLSINDIAVLQDQHGDQIDDYSAHCWRTLRNAAGVLTSGEPIDCNAKQDVKVLKFCSEINCETIVNNCPNCEVNHLPADIQLLLTNIITDQKYHPEIGDVIMVDHPNGSSDYTLLELGWTRSSCGCIRKISAAAGNLLTLHEDDNAPYINNDSIDSTVKVSLSDTTPATLLEKILPDYNISLTVESPGANEKVRIAVNDIKLVENVTAGIGSPNIIVMAEKGRVFTNKTASAMVHHTLPTAMTGLVFEYIVMDANGITITANTADKIRLLASESSLAGTISSTTLGSTVRLLAIDNDIWVATSYIGTWVLG